MLYLTTRDRFETFTAFHAIKNDTAPNGGLFVPFHIPKMELQMLAEESFGEVVAQVLNSFFATRLTGKQVEFTIGRNPIRIAATHQRTVIAELFRNLDGNYQKMEQRLAEKICSCFDTDFKITSWTAIAIRIAVLFGAFAEMRKLDDQEQTVDIALPCGDFKLTMAAWYAREMGLPIGNIICSCRQDSGVWDMLRHGEMRTSVPEPAAKEMERLICATIGFTQAVLYGKALENGTMYAIDAEQTSLLNRGIFCAVVSDDRIDSAISNVYRTSACILETGSAASYSGLMDYRAKTGESRTALLLADCNVADQADRIAGAMNITVDALKDLLRS